MSLYHRSKIYSYLPTVQDALGVEDLGCIQSTPVNVARFILDKAVDLFKLETRNTVGVYG